MIYFFVHNNLHYTWAEAIRREIQGIDSHACFGLIKFVPSALTKSDLDGHYQKVFESKGLFGGFWSLLNVFEQNRIKRHLDELEFDKNDIIFAFTEYEIATHYIIRKAKKAGSKVYIFDEGIGTYILNNYPVLSQGDSVKQRVIHYAIKYVNGFHHTQRLTGNQKLYFPRLDDSFYDGYVLFYCFPFQRTLPLYRVAFPARQQKYMNLDPHSVLILGQALYNYCLTMDEYMASLKSVIDASNKSFRHIYFKFHHSALPLLKTSLFVDLTHYMQSKGVNVIDFNEPIYVEDLVDQLDFPPKFIVSYFSTALLNLFARGCEPIFICNLLEHKDIDLMVVKRLLESAHYRFIKSYDGINPSYRSDLDDEAVFCSDQAIGEWYKQIAYAKS